MPIVARFEFTVEERFSGSTFLHRLTWWFFDSFGILLEQNQQDRDPASDDEHRAWLHGIADAWTQVTTELEGVIIGG